MSDRILYSISDAAKMLSIGRSKLYELINSGKIRTVKIDRRVLIQHKDIVAYVDSLIEGRRNGE